MSTSPYARPAAWATAALLTAIAGLQLYWGLGGTRGLHDASGGAMDHLSTSEQVLSVIAAVVLLALAGVVLARVGYWSGRVPYRIARIGVWAIAVGFGLGALVNLIAQTDFERLVNAPIALFVALLALTVARSAPPARPTRRPSPPARKPSAAKPVH